MKKLALVLIVAIGCVGCATYQAKVSQSRALLPSDPDAAAEMLKPLAEAPSKDQLIYLFDYATALQVAGKYKESNEVLFQAYKLTDLEDYVSISKQTASLLLNQEQVQYSGDDYEKVMINAMAAINFLMMGDLDGALVETRRMDQRLELFRRDGKKEFNQNVFAIYLSALIWESNKNWDDAYIAFEKAYNLEPSIPYLREDLVRAAKKAGRTEALSKWKSQFQIKEAPEWNEKIYGEVVLIYQQGWGPRKSPRPENFRFPYLYPVYTDGQKARLKVAEHEESTQYVWSLEQIAIQNLNEGYGRLVAKRMAGIVAKEVAAEQIRQKDKGLGALAYIVMHASDRADLRQWSTLPQTFQVAKKRLKPGKYKLSIEALTQSGVTTGESSNEIEVTVSAGKKTFITWRSFR